MARSRGEPRPRFWPLFVETQLFAFCILGWLVFVAVAAVGASGGGDLSAALDQRGRSRTRMIVAFTGAAYAICLIGPLLWPEHIDPLFGVAALGLLAITFVGATVFSVKEWARPQRNPW